jgi:hypothetical protein
LWKGCEAGAAEKQRTTTSTSTRLPSDSVHPPSSICSCGKRPAIGVPRRSSQPCTSNQAVMYCCYPSGRYPCVHSHAEIVPPPPPPSGCRTPGGCGVGGGDIQPSVLR